MSCTIKNPANYDLTNLEPHVRGMYDHFASKYGFKKPPTMVFDSDPDNQSKVLGKTAYYDPQSLEIHVFIDGRHPKDVLRSIAHELIHHRQNLESRLDTDGYTGPGYYLENDVLREVEHEAMLEGNATMREYEDTVKYKEKDKMSLKEWKNNELNKQLLKKFGILSESKKKKPDADGDGVPDWADKKPGKDDHADGSEEELDEGFDKPTGTVFDKIKQQAEKDKEKYKGVKQPPLQTDPETGEQFRSYLDDDSIERHNVNKAIEKGQNSFGPERNADGSVRTTFDDIKGTPKQKKNLEEDEKGVDDKKKKHLMNPDEFENKAGDAKEKKKKDDDDKNPPPKSASLQESLKRIAKAKNVFLNGKRVK